MIPIKTMYSTYKLKLPSTGKEINYRPFIEKERKLLLLATEANDEKETLNAIKSIISTCCENVNPETIPLFDIEYIFLQLRAKSIGEIIKLNFKCHNEVENKICGNVMKHEVDLNTVKVVGLKSDLKIKFDANIGLKMKYPCLSAIDNNIDKNSREYVYNILANSIEFIWEGENIYYIKDYSNEDTMEFIMNLTPKQFGMLEEFIEELPYVNHEFDHNCEKCGFLHKITLEGYQSFFI